MRGEVNPKRAIGIAAKKRGERKEERLESKQCWPWASPAGGATQGRASVHENLPSVLFAFFRGQFNCWIFGEVCFVAQSM
jgi:hypothetical protein